MGVTELRDPVRARHAPAPMLPRGAAPDRRWLSAGLWILPLVLAFSVGTAYVVTARQTPIFRGSATLVLVPATQIVEGSDLLRSLETLERRTVIATFAQLPSADRIRAAAARDIALRPDSLGYFRSQALVIPNTNLIRIEAEGPDAARAAAFANALASVTTVEAKAMYRVFEMTTLTAAVQPTVPVAPNPRRAVALAAILGAFLGVAATYLFVHPHAAAGARA
jgi:capsular polysaccharide biosynthesis protein